MSFVVVAGVPIPVAPGGGKVNWLDAVDRARAQDNTYRASATGNAKRDWQFSTPPVSRSVFSFYKSLLSTVTGRVCSGDVLEGSENLALYSENFGGAAWALIGTPTRTAADLVFGNLTLDLLGDDDGGGGAGHAEAHKQTITFAADGVKGVAVHVRQGTSISSVIRLFDASISSSRLAAALTWSGGLPVITITTGTDRGYDNLGSGVFRLKFGTGSSVDHTHTNELQIYPATDATLANSAVGNLDVGGVQVENNDLPGPYSKTTTATVSTLNPTCCTEVTGWTPVKAATDFKYVLDFALHEQ